MDNQDRARNGEQLVNTYSQLEGTDPDSPQDMIADLCHYWHSKGLSHADIDMILFSGQDHYQIEIEESNTKVKYPIGTRIRCIDSSFYSHRLTEGKVYTVSQENNDSSDNVWVRDDHGDLNLGTRLYRWELAEEESVSTKVRQLEQEVERLQALVKQQSEPAKDNPLLHEHDAEGREYALPVRLIQMPTFDNYEDRNQVAVNIADHMRFLRRIAALNAEQGWVCDWSNRNQKRVCFKLVTSREYNEYAGKEVKAQAYKDTQTLPDYHYMSEKTARIIQQEYTQEQLIDLITKGVLGL